MIEAQLLAILRCPFCANQLPALPGDPGSLRFIDETLLECQEPDCHRRYPILDEIPVLLLSQLDIPPNINHTPSQGYNLDYYYSDDPGLVERTITSYDLHADAFFHKHGNFKPIEAIEELQKYVPEHARILDVGCGLGRDTSFLISRGFKHTVGIDMSIKMLRTGSDKGRFRFPAVQGDMRRLPFMAGCFDVIWSAASLIHIPREHVLDVLQGFQRVMVADGYMYLSVIQGQGEAAEEGRTDNLERGWRYFVYYELDELADLLSKIHLEISTWWTPPSNPSSAHQGSTRTWLHLIVHSVK